jgi:glycosyltransferase involved in cell wall biosynthesis
MKIGFYSPYFDSLGGGERYTLTLASHWSTSHEVDIFWNNPNILSEAQKRFDINLSYVRTVKNIFQSKRFIRKLMTTSLYDCIFFLSDGSVPMSMARYNILHFQVPFSHVTIPFWKASRYQKIVCNSKFTRDNLDKSTPVPKVVIYPPVDVGKTSLIVKSKIILSVGRFSGQNDMKKFDILIEVFRNLHKQEQFHGWKFIMAGGLLKSDIAYFNELKRKSKGLPIELYPNCPLERLTSLYNHASLYWHAAGYNEEKPEHMEHFGITTVEAMAAGCIPLVYAGGGQKEIVQDKKTGFLWDTMEELAEKTRYVARTEFSQKGMRLSCQKRSHDFSTDRFNTSFDTLLNTICKNKS